MTKQCPLIQDLLPLYVDEAVTPDSRALIEAHLADCEECRQALKALQTGGPPLHSPLPEGAAPSADARFLTRLKRQVGTVIGLALVLLALTAFGASQFGRWRANQQSVQQVAVQQEDMKAALAAIDKASPDPLARLKGLGVGLTATAQLNGSALQVTYRMSPGGQVVEVHPLISGGAPEARLYDPTTNKDLGQFYQGGTEWQPEMPTRGEAIYGGVTERPTHAAFKLPYVLAYIKPEQERKWEIERPGESSEVPIAERITVAGVDFQVERVRFAPGSMTIDYHQLTDPATVGVHLLNFRVNDGLGRSVSESHPPTWLPNPARPSQRITLLSSLSKRWTIQVEAAVLAVPGPAIPLEVK